MITGDNIYTAIYIAKKSGIIEQHLPCYVGEVRITNGVKEAIFRNSDQSKSILDVLNWRVTNKDKFQEIIKSTSVGIAIDSETWRLLSNDPQYDEFLTHYVHVLLV